jgi:hypothetical protein
VLDFNGRGGGIRTRDPLHPMQVRYQAAPRPDESRIIAEGDRPDNWPLRELMQMSVTLRGFLWHFGMHNLFDGITEQR